MFIVGDRVECSEFVGSCEASGQTGTIIRSTTRDITVEFDNNIGGHNGSTATDTIVGASGCCWHFLPNTTELTLIYENKPAVAILSREKAKDIRNGAIRSISKEYFSYRGKIFKWGENDTSRSC